MASAMTASRYRSRKQKLFRSVFQTDVSQPTPRSTPVVTFPEFGAAFGDPHASTHQQAPPPTAFHQTLSQASDQVKWDRAWHVVTSRIQLPSSVAVEDSFGTLAPESQQEPDQDFNDALTLILYPGHNLPEATHTEDILSWHTQQVRHHFFNHVMPLLAACAGQAGQTQVLLSSISTLEAAHRQYLYGLTLILQGLEDEAAGTAALVKFRRDLHAIVGNSLNQGLSDVLRIVFHRLVRIILSTDNRNDDTSVLRDPPDDDHVLMSREELLALLESLQNVGLAGEKFQILFAEIMDQSMKEFITNTYSRVWQVPERSDAPSSGTSSGCLAHLTDWIENIYARLAVEVLSRLDVHIAWNDVECWKETAIGRLATLRIQELFDICLNWPKSKGGLDDLRASVTTPQRRLQLTDTFSAALQKRLLHPGRSTLEILQTYISMIKTFHALDQSKVLLDRVAHALQLYLCQRDDAIRIVVIGLLSNPNNPDDEGKTKLVELAVMLNSASTQQRRQEDDEELDWNDMSWVPDPVDAGANYKRPKNEDVVGSLINALGSQDIFIKEFQNIIAERLLSKQTSFQQEIKVLGLLKKRFGEAALQNCDVMMKDIYDSKRVDALLVKNIHRPDDSPELNYHSKILSRLFWPSLPNDRFVVPRPVADMQKQYERGFELLKTSRKLTWLDQIGSVEIKLEFEDRTVEVECTTYEAAVIYLFQEEYESEGSNPAERTFNEIWERLMMDEDLLESAIRFWKSKRVLCDAGELTYKVIERLDDQDAAKQGDGPLNTQNEADDSGHPSPRKQKNVNSKDQQRQQVYWQFIVGMLTNSAPMMPAAQILMMMKMLIPDGCTWNNEELQEFLGEKVAEGELEVVGGKYRLVKK